MLAMFGAAAAVAEDDAPISILLPTPSEIDKLPDFAAYYEQDADIQFATMLQQPATQPGAGATQPSVRRPTTPTTTPSTTSRQSNIRLASVPNMFGDCGMTTGNVAIVGPNGITNGQFMLPVVGGARTGKISENDTALPVDRIFFNYNHYTNIFVMTEQQVFPVPQPEQLRTEPIDRYTFGFEKTYFDQWTSIQLRMPFNGAFDANLQTTGVGIGNWGNLAVILKALLYQDDNLALGFGLGIDIPTGSDQVATLGTVNLRYQNDAVHLLPYFGFRYSAGDTYFGDGLFMTGFLQMDFANNGNAIQFVDPATNAADTIGLFNEQNVLYADLAVGYWLYRNPDAPRVTGLAAVIEAHYSTTVQDPDLVAGTSNGTGAVITNTGGRFDVVNGTVAVQMLLFDSSTLRVGGVFPMGQEDNKRFFDSEVQVQFNRFF